MSSWAKEPWRSSQIADEWDDCFESFRIEDANGAEIGVIAGGPEAMRVVFAVNACVGIENDELELMAQRKYQEVARLILKRAHPNDSNLKGLP